MTNDESIHFESLYPSNTRFDEIKQLVEFIKAGNSCQIIGLPGVGRSNLLRLLSYNRNVRLKHLGENQKWFHFVTTDFSEIRRRPLSDATKFLFLSLVDSLRERKITNEYEKANQIFKESIFYSSSENRHSGVATCLPAGRATTIGSKNIRDSIATLQNDRTLLNDELVLFQGLKKAVDFLAIEKELTIVFLFDRFEEYVPMLTPEFFSNLRILRNRAKYRFSAVFSLTRPLEDLLEPSLFADFYEFLIGHTIYLSLYDKAGTDFRISYLEKITGRKIEKKILDQVLDLTAGHGKLTRLALEAILASHSTSEESKSTSEVPFLLQQKSVLGALSEIWRGLTPSEQRFVNNVLLERSDRISSKQEILSRSLPLQDDNGTYLQNTGLIKNGKITIPLFKTFVKSHPTIQQYSNITITLDPNTNEIKKGDIVLSNQLTSSEFKLLRFFIQNPDRIIEREEIIGAVWKETQSTAGVTEQALDQLIFRLRKKIESDPNNPVYVQTIKGRGIRFSL